MKLDKIDNVFPTVPKEVREKIKSQLSKGSNLDDKGLNLLNLYKDGKVPEEKLNLAIKHLKRAQLPKGERVSSYDELKDKSIEAKQKALEPKEVVPEHTVKSKEFPKEKLFFPQSYAQLVAFSKYAIKQQGSKEDGERVNRWCVANEDNDNHYKRYVYDKSRFIVIVLKDKNGNLEWINRYLYSNDRLNMSEVADRLNQHVMLKNLPLSDEARTFIINHYKLSAPKEEKSETRSLDKLIRKTKNTGVIELKGGDEISYVAYRKLYDKENRNDVEYMKNITFTKRNEKNSYLLQYFKNLKEITFNTNATVFNKYMMFVGFQGCESLERIELPVEDIPVSAENLFYNSRKLKEIKNIRGWKLNGIFELTFAHTAIERLESIDVSKIESFRSPFWGCENLTSLDMSNPNAWTFKGVAGKIEHFKSSGSWDKIKDNYAIVLDMSDCPLDEATKKELVKRNPILPIKFKE